MRGDDGVGCEVAERLSKFNSERFMAVDCGDAPDAFAHDVTGFMPSHVLIVDAAELGEEPGTAKLLYPEGMGALTRFISTHELPLNLTLEILRLEGGIDVAILGIQVGQVSLGSGMSPQVRRSAEQVVELLLEVLRSVGILEHHGRMGRPQTNQSP